MEKTAVKEIAPRSFWKTMGWGALVLAVLIGFVFRKSFEPGQILFSNDGPLGPISSQSDNPLGAFSGFWQPLNWIGYQAPNALPTLSNALVLVTTPVSFSKLYAPFSIFVLGLAAVALFYRLGFSLFTCVIGGIATAFSTDYFSYACWGLGSLTLCIAFSFFALAALAAGRSWVWPILGGFSVGMAVTEGFDSGAIMSLYIAAFVLFRAWVERQGNSRRGLTSGIVRLAVVAIFAVFIAAQALTTLIGTQISGIAGASQKDAGKEERWDFATQWSLPKAETLRVLIPGLYGYRMDTPEGGSYWGTVGQQPGWETHHSGIIRFSGAGFYVGIIVLLLAAYGLFESLRKDSPLGEKEKALVKFWAVAALLSLLFSFGRFAPFYRLVYALPYFSSIRNPVKFMHPFSLSIVVMFGYGMHALLLRSNARARHGATQLTEKVKQWWNAAAAPERRWTWGCATFAAISLLGLLVYTSSAREMTEYLQQVQIAPNEAPEILKFSYREIRWFLAFLVAGIALFVLFASGYFGGKRLRVGVGILGALIIADMIRANEPWVIYYDYREKYASNPVIDFLRQEPYDHRVATKFNPFGAGYIVSSQDQMNSIFSAVCNEWLQHHFQYYRIQSLDIIQMPRIPELDSAFADALRPKDPKSYYLFGRLWQVTNTRYFLGERSMLDVLNNVMDAAARRFTIVTNFDIVPKTSSASKIEDFTARLNPNGRYSIFEFGGALPRSALYTDCRVGTNDVAVLTTLADTNFNPRASAFVDIPAPASISASTNSPGAVKITKYQPRRVELSADVKAPSLLVLFDRWDPQWSVTVDGQKQSLIRADYIFRGVYLTPGNHQVHFRFRTPLRALYISLTAIVLAVFLCLYVALRPEQEKA
jgi:hypothetical protein